MAVTRKKPVKRATKPRTTPATARKRTTKKRTHHHPELWGLGMVAVGLFLATVLWLGWDGGTVGATVVDGLHDAFGVAAYLIPLVLISVGVLMLVRSRLVDLKPFRTGLVVGAFGLMIALGRDEGGAIGGALGGALAHVIGETGALIVGVALFIAGTLLFTGASAGAVLRRSGTAMRNAGNAARRSLDTRDGPGHADDDSYDDARVTPRRAPVDAVMSYPDVIAPVASSAEAPPLVAQADEYTPDELTAGDGEEIDFETAPAGDYRLPERSLLKASPPVVGDNGVASAKIADQLVKTLSHFGVDATIVGQIAGPRVVRYELQLAPGTKVSKVAGLKDDLSYALATTEIRILAPIPGKQAVGVEVPNLSPKLVTLGDIFGDMPGQASPLSVWLGKDISGNAVWTDLARMPHLLIAGTTGSGKSGCINTLLTSILLRSTPDEVRMILIDPKRIELNYYESIPHLLTPVVSNPKEASAVLQNVVAEMERRYERLSIIRARNLPEANRAVQGSRGGAAAVPAGRDRRARRPDDGLAAGGRGRDHPPRPKVARGRHPPRARDAAAVGRRDHRHDQGQRPVADRVRGLEPDGLPRDPRHLGRREPARPGRHALQAARHLAHAARPGRLCRRGGGRDDRRAVPPPARPGARREPARGTGELRATTWRTATTASSTQTRIRCSTRRSRSWCRPRPPRSRSFSAACASATRGPAASSTCSSGAASSPATRVRSRAGC